MVVSLLSMTLLELRVNLLITVKSLKRSLTMRFKAALIQKEASVTMVKHQIASESEVNTKVELTTISITVLRKMTTANK